MPVPRNFRFTRLTQFSRSLGLTVWIVIAVGLFYFAYRHITMLQGLLTTGKVINATVTDKYVNHGKSTSYHLRYTYTVNQVDYDDNESVSWNEYDDTGIGAALTITYLPSNPAIDRPGTVTAAMIQLIKQNWVLSIGAFCTIYGILFAVGENNFKKRLILVQYGIATRARVTSKDQKPSGKSTTFTVSYSFAADDKPIWHTVTVPILFYQNVMPGDDISVLYMQRDPIDSLPYRAITEVEVA